jgi:hypothetical protein
MVSFLEKTKALEKTSLKIMRYCGWKKSAGAGFCHHPPYVVLTGLSCFENDLTSHDSITLI